MEGAPEWSSGAGKGINSVSERRSKARAIMVWSLSKDDDGLESVHPLTNQGASLSSSGERASGERSAGGAPSSTARRAPSVFVDPRSQIPQTRPVSQRRQEVEATMVLTARKVDEMRAEVARQKLAYRRRKRRMFVLWVLAGGAALAMGWFAGILLSPAPSEKLGAPSAFEHQKVEDDTRSAAKDVRPEEETAAITSLEELPPDEDERNDTSPPPGEAAFTLDELPAD